MDFTRSSKHAWNLMKKLNPDKSKKTEKQTVISADTVAKQIEKRGNAHSETQVRTKRQT